MAAAQPVGVAGFPSVVVDARGELGNIVGGRVALDAGDFAEVVDGVAGVARAAAYAEEEDTAALFAGFDSSAIMRSMASD